MADLVARDKDGAIRWRHRLPPGEEVSLGRESAWATPWDGQISRKHAELHWHEGRLRVRRQPTSRNPIVFGGEVSDDFTLAPGEEFVIGETSFTLEDTAASPSGDLPPPYTELTCSPQELQQVPYAADLDRIEVLAALPGVIRTSCSDRELECRVVDVLLRGLPRADVAAVVRLHPGSPTGDSPVDVVCARRRLQEAPELRPSRRLVFDAVARRRQSVMHLWAPGGLRPEGDVTVDPRFDWALCVPLADDSSPGWGVYVAGRLEQSASAPGASPGDDLLKSDLKFSELVAEVFGSLRLVLDLQRRQTLLARFLSRPVLAAIADRDMDEVLQARETEVTVLFCDLRGSCRIAEEGQRELTALWERVSAALNIMAGRITDQDGVIGDFQGDAAMGFWGWPLPCEDRIERAARAALAIQRRFAQVAQLPDHPLAGFTCGIGIATGPAIAGKLGTLDQFKVDVFGPTVNLASRLESMTKLFRAPILVDEASAERLSRPGNHSWVRCRRLARLQPYGMRSTVLTVSELLPSEFEPGTLSERGRRDYEAALEAFVGGRWVDAGRLLARLPEDGAAAYLTAFMERHRQTPPRGWNGVLVVEDK